MFVISLIGTIISMVADGITIYSSVKEKKNTNLISKKKIILIICLSVVLCVFLSLTISEGVQRFDIGSIINNGDNNHPFIVNTENGNTTINYNSGGSTPTPSPTPTSTPTPQPTIGITVCNLNKNAVYLQPGESFDLKCTVLCSDNSTSANIVWVSTDSEVAEVHSNATETGTIMGLSIGKASIIAQVTTGTETRNVSCDVEVLTPPAGYTISASKDKVKILEVFDITIIPFDNSVTEIIACAESPSGNISYGNPYKVHNSVEYWIKDFEYGTWKIYAKIKNEVGVYEGASGDEVIYIKVEPLK